MFPKMQMRRGEGRWKDDAVPRDGACVRRVRRKDNRIGATVATPVQWAVIKDSGWKSEAVINVTNLRASGSNYRDTFFGTSVLNGWGLVGDRGSFHAPVGLIAGSDP